MPFSRPALSTIVDRIKADIKSGLQLQAILRRSFEEVISKALGGASHTLHGNIQNGIEEKFFPDTGDEATVIRWGTLYNVPRNDATFARLNVDIVFTGVATLIVGTVYQRSDGFQYTIETEITSVGAETINTVIIASEAGENGNLADSSTVSLLSPVANVETDATVTTTATEGEDQEELEDYRTRVLERLQQPPSGGTVHDYIAFAKTVTGVTRVWVLPNLFASQGEVGLTFVEDGNAPASIIPSPAKVTEVQDAVVLLKPINADLTTFAPNESVLDMTISIKPNTLAVRAAVTAEIEDVVFREAQVRNAVDPEQVGLGVQFDGTIALSKLNEAISIASGEEDHVIVSPATDPQAVEGGLLTLGTITFQTLA